MAAKALQWSSFPRGWVRGTLKAFTAAGGQAGLNMAALRVYLALALKSDFKTKFASISWTDLEELTGLSRPTISRGIRRAAEFGLIKVDDSGHRHGYTLLGSTPAEGGVIPFARIPTVRLKAVLARLPARGRQALNCLKIYIALVTVRPRNTITVSMSHKKLVEWTGMQPREVRAAIDVLINHNLVHLGRTEFMSTAGHPYNEYFLLGLSQSDEQSSKTSESERGVPARTTAVIPVKPSVLEELF